MHDTEVAPQAILCELGDEVDDLIASGTIEIDITLSGKAFARYREYIRFFVLPQLWRPSITEMELESWNAHLGKEEKR